MTRPSPRAACAVNSEMIAVQSAAFPSGSIADLEIRYRETRDVAVATALREKRTEIGRELCRMTAHTPSPVAGAVGLRWAEGSLPEIDARNLDAAAIADGVVGHGALLVRGLYPADQIQRMLHLAQGSQESPVGLGCSDVVLAALIELYRDCGLLAIVTEYLGGQPVLFGERAKLRRHLAERDRFAAIPWHQDVSFFGRTSYALNCWAALTPCGEDCPGLGVIPRRMDERVGWDGDGPAPLDYGRRLPEGLLESLEGGHPVAYPVFAPGDALLFDEMTLHTTSRRRWQRADQVVTISWFFRAAGFPDWGTPLAL